MDEKFGGLFILQYICTQYFLKGVVHITYSYYLPKKNY